MTTTIEETETAETNPKRKATRGARRANVAPKRGKAGKKAGAAKKAPRSEKKAKRPRQATKTATVLELLTRPGGVTLPELMKETGWQPHSIRGFLSGTIGKKMGLTLVSAKQEDGNRIYSIKH